MFLAFPSLLTDLNREHRGCKRSRVWAVLNFTTAVWFRAEATDHTAWLACPCQGMRCLAWFTVPQFHYSRLVKVCTGCRWLQRVPRIPCCVYCVRRGRNSVWVRFTEKKLPEAQIVERRMGRTIIEQRIAQDVEGSGRSLFLSIACGGKPQKLQTPSPSKYVNIKGEKKNLLLPSSGSLFFHAGGYSRFIRNVDSNKLYGVTH